MHEQPGTAPHVWDSHVDHNQSRLRDLQRHAGGTQKPCQFNRYTKCADCCQSMLEMLAVSQLQAEDYVSTKKAGSRPMMTRKLPNESRASTALTKFPQHFSILHPAEHQTAASADCLRRLGRVCATIGQLHRSSLGQIHSWSPHQARQPYKAAVQTPELSQGSKVVGCEKRIRQLLLLSRCHCASPLTVTQSHSVRDIGVDSSAAVRIGAGRCVGISQCGSAADAHGVIPSALPAAAPVAPQPCRVRGQTHSNW